MRVRVTPVTAEEKVLCPVCGRTIETCGPNPEHMAFCRGGCGWYGIVEHCDIVPKGATRAA